MSYSTLATAYIPAHNNNHYGFRTTEITEIMLHHMVAIWTAERCAQSFQDPERGASVNYCVGNEGDIVCGLDEKYAPGSCGYKTADQRAVSIEISNSAINDYWPVGNAALNSAIKLAADIAKRNRKVGRLIPGKNLTWHSMYAATTCPGDYLRSMMSYIAEQANKINGYGDLPFKLVDGVNIHRGADKLIKYTSGKTGTNKWGVEVRIDKSGIVLDAPKYGARNMTVPEGGCVLSGHNLAGSWMLENIKKGYSVAFEDGGVTVIPTGKGYIAGTNIHRAADTLILYKGKASTGTNIWGKEIACDKNGKVTKVMPWGKGNTAIPSGGFVLSGHGKGTDVLNNIKVGMTVKIVNRKVIYK